jgi:long-chain fatty acid transport protein
MAIAGGAAGGALASGFALKEQGGAGLGNAFAGVTAGADDLSTMFFNPAGLTRFSGNQGMGSLSIIAPTTKFTNRGSTDVLRSSLTGGNGGDGGEDAIVPAFYAMWDYAPDLKFGVAINSPFGLVTSYDSDWVGRYHGTTSSLKTFNIQPTAAYKITPWLSLGAGVHFDYATAKLANAVDFGTVCVSRLPTATCSALGLLPQRADGGVTVQGDSMSAGFTLGATVEPMPGLRAGIAYRSQVTHELKGRANFTVPTAASVLTAGGTVFQDSDVRGRITLPETVGAGIAYDISPKLTVMADAVWTHWSRFKELRFKFDNPLQPDAVTPEDWNDTWFFALGATYRHDERWTFRFGVAFDKSPIDDDFRTPRIPDQDRRWVALGIGYKLNDSFNVDLGYTHIFVDKASINNTDSSAHLLVGDYKSHIDILSVNATLRF